VVERGSERVECISDVHGSLRQRVLTLSVRERMRLRLLPCGAFYASKNSLSPS
jgi:hypothetical protein